MISVENLEKSFGGQNLFREAGFKINPKERIGLVGRKGHGKTTLFRLLTGDEEADSGKVVIPKNYSIGYLKQHLDFTEETVLEEGMKGLPANEAGQHWKVEKILFGLGFSESDMKKHPSSFSGGFQVRLNLAKVLVSEPDLLLLDEPTNYLDITSIRWIEGFLKSWPRELLLITHDRSFMDKIVTHTIGIHRNRVRKLEGNTEKFYARIAQDEEIYEKTRLNDERKTKEIEQFVSRFRAKARLANMVQSRIKTLSRMEKKDRLEKIEDLDFSFRYKPYKGKQVLRVNDLAFSYPTGEVNIDGLNLTVGAKDRICVVGPNGNGKTTLLKLLAGKLKPLRGSSTYNPGIDSGFFEQTNVKSLVDSRTVEEEIAASHPDVERQAARNICGAMMFEGDMALKTISVLSGGEKSRVMLGKLLVTPLNVLLLDEPTNHLDMESCDALLAAIDQFEGAVIMVTHNEMFLHALAERLIVFQNSDVSVFNGSYSEFLEKVGWQSEQVEPEDEKCTSPSPFDDKISKKDLRRLRSEIITRRSKVIKPLERKITAVEEKIEATEDELAVYNEEMLQASMASDGDAISRLSRLIHESQSSVDALFDTLEELTDKLESENDIFQKELDNIDAMP